LAHGLTDLHGSLSGIIDGLLDIFNVRNLKVLILDFIELIESFFDLLGNIAGNLASELFKLTLGGLVNAMSFVLEINKFSSLLILFLELLGLLQHTFDVIL